MANASFDILDYSLFGITLLLSAAVGLFFSLRKGKGLSANDEMLMGGHSLPVIPTALSLLTSFISGISLLGIPTEIYLRSVNLWWTRIFGTITALPVIAYVVLPIFYRLQLISIYEYLELRYNSRLIRYISAIQYIFITVFYVGVVLYAPSNALSRVTGIQAWVFVLTVGVVCIIYTSIGGIRSVIWTDTLQALFMFTGCIALFVKGTLDSGGFKFAYENAVALGRFDGFKSWVPNPFRYDTMWFASLGGFSHWLAILGFNQISLQRYLCLPNQKAAKRMAIVNVPFYALTVTLTDLIGLAMLAYYFGCDPLSSKKVDNQDQLVIHFSLDILGKLPGFPGIFLACIFSGTLSTVSSGINSIAAVLMEDFIEIKWPYLSDTKKGQIIRSSGFLTGGICIALAFAVAPLGGMTKAILTLQGVVFGPTLAIFLAGMIFRSVNRYGIYVAYPITCILMGVVAVGNNYYRPYARWAPGVTTDNCSMPIYASNTSSIAHAPDANFYQSMPVPLDGIKSIFYLPEMNYTFFGATITMLIALLVSWVWKDLDMPSGRTLDRLVIFYDDRQEKLLVKGSNERNGAKYEMSQKDKKIAERLTRSVTF